MNDLVLHLNQMDRMSNVSHNSDPHEAHNNVQGRQHRVHSCIFLSKLG